MCFGYVPIFIGGGEGLRVEQRGPVRGAKNPSVRDYLRSQKKWKIALRISEIRCCVLKICGTRIPGQVKSYPVK